MINKVSTMPSLTTAHHGLAIADAMGIPVLKKLVARAECQLYAKGQTIFSQGDPATGLYLLSEGQVHLVLQHSPVGQTKILRLVKRGEVFGDIAVFMESSRVLTAVSAQPSTVLYLPADAIISSIQEDRDVALGFLSLLSRQIHSLVTEIEVMAVGSGTFRVIQFILDEVGAQKLRLRGKTPGMLIPATKQDVASLLNLSKEHFSRTLSELVQQGLITMSGRYVGVPSLTRLKRWQLSHAARNKAH